MKITLDEDTLSKAVISHLKGVGVQSDILEVKFRYTRVPYTVFAEVELAEAQAPKPTKKAVVAESAPMDTDKTVVTVVSLPLQPLVDPDNLPAEDPPEETPRPDRPAAPLFGSG